MSDRHLQDLSPTTAAASGDSLLHRLWRRRMLFVAVFSAIMVITIIALRAVPVRYAATGSVIVVEQEPGNANASAVKTGDPADVESQLLILKSPRLMRLALDAPGVRDAAIQDCVARSITTSGCEAAKQDTGLLVDYIAGHYSVGVAGRSRVIDISYASPIPGIAQTMANALTNAFLDDQRVAGAASKEAAAAYLWKQARQLEVELRDADARIQAFRNKAPARSQQAPISSERLAGISQQLANAETARADAAARLQEIKGNQARVLDSPAAQSNRSIGDLKQQLAAVAAQLASQSNALGPRHPSIRALEQEQASIRERLKVEVAGLIASAQRTFDFRDALVKTLTRQIDAAKSDAVKAEVSKVEVGTAPSDEASIESLARNTEIKRAQYADLYRRASELETERRVWVGSTRLVSLAELPTTPTFPNDIRFIAAGSALALLLASLAVLVVDRLRRQVLPRPERLAHSTPQGDANLAPAFATAAAPAASNAPVGPQLATPVAATVATFAPTTQHIPAFAGSSSELAVVTGAPILARLPVVKRDGSESTIGAILSAQSGTALARSLPLASTDLHYQDALRDLSANLLITGHGKPRKTILVASPSTAEGKTFLTLSLAQHLAAAGRSVLVIECDLGAPKFATALGLRSSLGLPGILRGEAMPGDCVVSTGVANLDAIPAGPVAASADLLRKPLTALLQWAKIYDVVLIDAPSPGLHTDIGPLARQVDGVLLCMRAGRSSIGQAVATSSAVRSAGGELFGIAITVNAADADERRASTVASDAFAEH